jgi:serine/threonine-protein kinase RsbT
VPLEGEPTLIVNSEKDLLIASEADIVAARGRARTIASELGFTGTELVVIATAISEVARNALVYAGGGRLSIHVVQDFGRSGVGIVVEDNGPGIADLDLAMQDGYSTGGSLGIGLPGARRLMDEFHVESKVGEGTRVEMVKWAV